MGSESVGVSVPDVQTSTHQIMESTAFGLSNHLVLPSEANQTEFWYLRIDDKEFGPVPRSELEHFLRPPRICSSLQVMCSTQSGEWYTITRNETIDKVLTRFGIESHAGVTPIQNPQDLTPSPKIHAKSASVINSMALVPKWVAGHLTEAMALVAIVVVNAVILFVSANGFGRERQILAKFESIWDSVRDFSSDETLSEEWRSFADSAIQELEPLVAELQRSANVRRPARQALLFAGRDGLLKILREQSPMAMNSEIGTQIEVRLQQAHRSLPQYGLQAPVQPR
jgi:hypothetical protein